MIEIISYPNQRMQHNFVCPTCNTSWYADVGDCEDIQYVSDTLNTNKIIVFKVTCPICGRKSHIENNTEYYKGYRLFSKYATEYYSAATGETIII